MEKLLLPLGKGFAVIFIGIKGMHAFEWLRPGEVALVDPDRTKDAGCLGVHFLFLWVVLNIIKIVFNVFRHVLRGGRRYYIPSCTFCIQHYTSFTL